MTDPKRDDMAGRSGSALERGVRASRADLNTREPHPTMLLRLLAEAEAGRPCDVKLTDALEFRRDQYGLSNSEFAALLGMSLTHYGEVLNGRRDLPKGAMRRAYAIGVPADALLQPSAP